MAGKNAKPPPLPIDVFQRVLRVALFDGRLLLIIAGTFAVMAAMGRQPAPTIAGVIAAGWGALEIHAGNRLGQGDPKGLDWMILSQIGLMFTVFGYAGWMMTHFDAAEILASMPQVARESLDLQFKTAGIPENEMPAYLQSVSKLAYALVALLTFVFQGMMARFYQKSRGAVNTVIFGAPGN